MSKFLPEFFAGFILLIFVFIFIFISYKVDMNQESKIKTQQTVQSMSLEMSGKIIQYISYLEQDSKYYIVLNFTDGTKFKFLGDK